MSEEAILSEELLAELGNDPNAVIVGKKRKQALTEEEKKIKYMPQEELKKFKKLSKKEQKKVLQREKKRERASKLGEYMDVIKANEISQEQRDMLQSSSQLNHTATLREQLTLLLKKERAGIKLTDEELDVLYPNRHQAADSDEAEDEDDTPDAAIETRKGSIKPSSVVLQPSPASNIVPIDSNNATEGDTLFSFTSLFKPAAAAPPSNSDSEDDARAAKKNSKKKKKKAASNDAPPITEVEEPSSSVSSVPAVLKAPVQPEEASTKPAVTTEEKKPFSAAGLGKNLLAQFSKIKEQKAAADSTGDDKDRKVSTIFSAEFDYDPHKPHAFVSNVPHHDDAALVATGAEPSKVVIAKKPLVEDTFFNYRRHMTIERPHQVAMDRMNLPVCQMEQEIVEAVHNHDVIILCGETGSGKSTQVPQFLYEAGYAQDEDHLIGIAQPRRVAVTSTAERVNFEMGSTLPALARQKKLNKRKKNQRKLRQKQRAKGAANGGEDTGDGGDDNDDDDDNDDNEAADGSDDEALLAQHYPNGRKVGYQIRYDSTTVGSDTRVKFMTDGILLREISQDLLLRKYSVIILDEAHERNVNTDILLGMISRAIPLRKEIAAKEYSKWKTLSPAEQADFATPLTPLKLIIMSATLRVDDFCQERLFHPLPPIIKVEARQYPVTNHFAKRTEIRDYLQETFKKTCQIHERLPAGGVLVFLTGKREILYMCQRLQRALGRKRGRRGGGSGAREQRRPVASTTAAADGGEAGDADADADDAPLVAMLNNLKQQAATATDGDVGFDGDQVDEIDAGSDVDEDFADDGDDDYDAMNWDDQRQLADADEGDDESVLSDIDDEDYVKAPVPAKKQPRDGSDSDEDEDDEAAVAAKLRREMLAKVLGKGAAPAADADADADAAKDDEKAKENAADAAADAAVATSDAAATDDAAAAPPTVDNAPKLKPWILPLYAMMPAHLQKKIFAPVPKGHRLIVVATNVAETSITIPGIRYVVDSGRCKEKVLASASTGASDDGGAQASVYEAGITRYEVRWISKASADQRAGRAGRTGPGHCYRLFSSNFYHEHMQAFMPPEINVTPLEDIVLHMLSLGITEIESFPFPSNPPRAAVHAAVALLKNLGAIEPETAAMRAKERDARLWALLNQQAHGGRPATTSDEAIVLGHLSPLGKMLRWFPIHPRFAKMLVIATQTTQTMRDVSARYRLLSHVLTMVATLTERSVFVFDDAEANDDDNGDDESGDDSDGDDASDAGDDEDDNGGAQRRKRKASASTKQRVAKKAKTSTKEARRAEGRKLFHHASGDVMARLRATGAYLFTLYAALRRLRRERLLTEAAARREQTRKQAAMNEDDAARGGGDDDNDDDDALSIDAEAERKPFQKWEYDAANLDASVVALCQKFHLHQGTLQRIVDLRNQLQHILQGLYHRLAAATSAAPRSDDDEDDEDNVASSFDIVLEPPTTAEETALRQILLSGYCDQIAKRAPFATIEPHLQRLHQQQQQQLHQTPSSPAEKPINFLSRRRKFTAYVSGHPSLQTTGPVYVHPTSNCYAHDITLASETLPEYVVYTHMMKNQRGDCLYLTNVTVVSPQWITDVALTCPLVSIRHSDVMHQLDLASAASGQRSGAKKPSSSSSSSLVGGKKRRSALSDDEDDDEDDAGSGAEDNALVASSSLRGKSIAPFYDEQRECMMLYVKPRYGVHLWTLPTTVLPMRYVLEHWHTGDASSSSTSSSALVTAGGTSTASSSAMPVGYRMEDLEFRWFARCLLFGQVMFPVPVPQLQRACLHDVHCIQQSKPHPKLLPVLRRLVEARVASRGALTQQLAQQSNFLAKELEALLKPDQQRGFRVAWMRLAQYAAAAAKATPPS